MKKAILAAPLCLCSALYGQGVAVHDNVTTPAKNTPLGAQAPLYTVPYAQVTLCDSTCANPVNAYADVALTQLLPQPILADAQGRFSFFVAPGSYLEQLYSPLGVLLSSVPISPSSAVNSGQITNNWAINQQGQTFYFEGSSITIGYTLGTQVIPGGGYAGNYGNLLSTSVWGNGKGTYYNDGVSGSTTSQTLARYTVGNTALGVSVPSAHSVSPRVTCSAFPTSPVNCAREIFFLDLTSVVNSANAGISTQQSIQDTQALISQAQADGYFVVLMTSPATQVPFAAASDQEVWDVNAAARNGTIACDLFVDFANVIPNEYDGNLYTGASPTNMALHPTAIGQQALASALLAAMIGHGSASTQYSGDYHQEPTTIAAGLVNATPNNVTSVRNTNTAGFSAFAFLDNHGVNQGQVGYANSGTGVLASRFYVNSSQTTNPLVLAAGGIPVMTLQGAGITLGAPFASSVPGGGVATIQSTSATGYSNVALLDNLGNAVGQLNYSNPSAATLPGLFGLNAATPTGPIVMSGAGVERARFSQKGLQLSLSSVPISQSPTAPTGACTGLAWVLSDDGHMTYCNGTTFQLKF